MKPYASWTVQREKYWSPVTIQNPFSEILSRAHILNVTRYSLSRPFSPLHIPHSSAVYGRVYASNIGRDAYRDELFPFERHSQKLSEKTQNRRRRGTFLPYAFNVSETRGSWEYRFNISTHRRFCSGFESYLKKKEEEKIYEQFWLKRVQCCLVVSARMFWMRAPFYNVRSYCSKIKFAKWLYWHSELSLSTVSPNPCVSVWTVDRALREESKLCTIFLYVHFFDILLCSKPDKI